MIIKKQRNVYNINPSNKIYKGYIETYISEINDSLIRYKFSALEITSVAVYKNGQFLSNAIFTIEFLKDKVEDKNLFKSTSCNFLNIRLEEIDGILDVKIKIDFINIEKNSSVVFYKPVNNEDKHREMLTINAHNDSSGIFPSIDTNQSYEWELIYIYKSMEEFSVISPGILKTYVEEDEFVISSYSVSESISGDINFSVGTFKRYEIISGDDKKLLFCPLYMDFLSESILEIIDDFINIIKYVEYFIQMTYPLESLNVVFTALDFDKVNSMNIAIYNISNISTFNDIEPKFLIKRIIAEIITTQIFFHLVYAKDPTDHWIFCGFQGYLEDYCVRLLLGNNEFLYQYKKDKDFVISNDIYELPLCHKKRNCSTFDSDFYKKKCKLVFHAFENNLSKAFLEKICHFFLEKKNQITENFTADFFLLIKDITGKDMKHFFEFYVFRPGLIKVNFKFSIDPKKNKVDYHVTQEPTSKLINKNTKVLGNLTLMSYEVEGSFEHSLNFLQPSHFYYHIRTKKRKKVEEDEDEIMPLLWMRLDPKREHLIDCNIQQPDYMFIEQVLDKNVIGQLEALKELSKNPSIQVCEVLERLLENSHVFYKIRINVMYCLTKINIENFIGFQRLIQFYTKKYFVQSSTIVKPNEFMFINYFLQKHCVRALSLTDPFIIRNYNEKQTISSNVICSFITNILKYNDNSANTYNDSWFIASVIENLSRPLLAIQFHDSKSNKDEVKKIEFDENSSDDLKEIFEEEPNLNLFDQEIRKNDVDKTKFIKEALEEVERYRIMDMIFPSHKNIISEASIYLFGRLSLYGCLGMKKETLIDFTKYPNTFKVRKAAFIMLILLYNDDSTIIEYLFAVIKNDVIGIKKLILKSWIYLLEIKPEITKLELKDYKKDFFNLLIINEYDLDFKNKIYEIIDFLEEKDLKTKDYYEKIIEFSKMNYDEGFFIDKISFGSFSGKVGLKLKNFLEMKKQCLKESYILKLFITKALSEPKEIKQEKSINPIINEIKFESKADNFVNNLESKKGDSQEQKNEKLEDKNLQEMLKFEELENFLGEEYNFNTGDNKTITFSSNELSSTNLTSKPEYFNRLVNYENDQLNESSKQTNYNINKLINDFRNQVSENSRKSDSLSFSGVYDFIKPDNLGKVNFNEISEKISFDETFEKSSSYGKKKIVEKNISEDDSDEEVSYSCKTQVLEEKDFDKQFDRIDFVSSKNNISTFKSYSDFSLQNKNSTNFSSQDIKSSNFTLFSADQSMSSLNLIRDRKEVPLKIEQPITHFNTSAINTRQPNFDMTSRGRIFTNQKDFNTRHESNSIENFLDDDVESIVLPSSKSKVYRINELILRFKISTKIRIPAFKGSISSESEYKKKIKKVYEDFSSPEFYSSKRIFYQIKQNDIVTKKLFYGTVNNISIKQVNKVIFKNKNNSFFDWRPKTFKEIEMYVSNENKYKKVLKEMERSLVFALSYSQFGSRTFNIAKRLFDLFEKKIYETNRFPKLINPMSEQLRNYCVDFLNKICLNERFLSFIRPVNIEGLDAYVDIVRYPMCLDIVQKKLMKYLTLECFYGDIKQIIKNCCNFNQNDSEIVQSAKKLLKITQEYDKYLINIKREVRSEEVIILFLQRFEDSIFFPEIVRKLELKQICTFHDLINEIRNIKSTSMRKFISQQELHSEIEFFEEQLFHAFNVYNGKVYSWDIY